MNYLPIRTYQVPDWQICKPKTTLFKTLQILCGCKYFTSGKAEGVIYMSKCRYQVPERQICKPQTTLLKTLQPLSGFSILHLNSQST